MSYVTVNTDWNGEAIRPTAYLFDEDVVRRIAAEGITLALSSNDALMIYKRYGKPTVPRANGGPGHSVAELVTGTARLHRRTGECHNDYRRSAYDLRVVSPPEEEIA
jgi:hypothetical protein